MAQILSDLHLELRSIGEALDWIQGLPVTDRLLILAGDIHNQHIYKVLEAISKKWEQIIYVPGNHEFYGERFRFQNQRFDRIRVDFQNVVILQNSIYLDLESNLTFAGTTLWSSWIPQTLALRNRSGDFRWIKENYQIPKMNLEAKSFLLENPQVDVVITHHAPSPLGINPEYVSKDFRESYFTPMLEDSLVFKGATWIHGHTHISQDIQHPSGVRMIANCAGYDWDVPNFDPARNYTLRGRQ